MAVTQLTILDLVTRQYSDILTGLVEDVTIFAPEFTEIPVTTRTGITYRVLSRTKIPTPSFRIANAGVAPVRSVYRSQIKEMFFLDAPIVLDEMVRKGDDGTAGDLLSQEAQGVLQGALIYIGSQVYYGTSNDGNGFHGLRGQLSDIVGAGGTTNSTSAYAVWTNPHGVCFDVGRDGEISLPPFQRYPIPDPNNSGSYYWGWASNLSMYIGLAVKSNYSVWAITGLTDTWSSAASNQYFTDSIAAKLVEKIPLARRTGLKWFINRSAWRYLQSSRSSLGYQPAGAVNGAPAWSPAPRECEGYPIVVTDSITNTEDNT